MSEISHLDDVHSWTTSTFRGLRGLIVKPHNQNFPPRPEEPLELYEFEACPFCRKVREVMTELDLSFVTRTCARGAESKREVVEEKGGKRQFPYLIDPNNSVEMYESEDIITYLAEVYGPGRIPLGPTFSPINTGLAAVASAVRPRGRKVREGFETREQPDELLVLYNIEASPYCRKVRERLNELNLDYRVENVGKLSSRRPELEERGGEVMVPYLIDANEGVEMYESDEIVAYLEDTYGSA